MERSLFDQAVLEIMITAFTAGVILAAIAITLTWLVLNG